MIFVIVEIITLADVDSASVDVNCGSIVTRVKAGVRLNAGLEKAPPNAPLLSVRISTREKCFLGRLVWLFYA